MRNWIGYIVLCGALLSIASSKNSIEDQQKDFSIFKDVLLSKEGHLDLHADESEVFDALKELEQKFATEQSLLDQFKLYAATLSKVQCGHTQIHPNKEVFREWLASRNSLPIDMYFIGKRLVVNKLESIDYPYMNEGKSRYEQKKRIQAGSEILTLDHKTIDEIMQKIGHFLSSDENGIDFKYFQAEQMFDFYRHIGSPFTKDSIHIKYVFESDTNEIYMRPGVAPVRTMNQRLRRSAYLFKRNEENWGEFKIIQQFGYFRFYSFKSSYGKKFDLFLEQSFEKIKSKKVKKLIIDLRGNTGGAMQYSFMRYIVGENVSLGRYVVEKPKNGIENRHLNKFSPDYFKHKRASKMQKRLQRKAVFDNGTIKTKSVQEHLIFDGEIVVITDEGTFSSASILACHLKTLANAKIIGRTAGGSFYIGNAGTLILELPKSKLKMFVNPNTFYSHLERAEDPFIIKQPDLVLNPLILDKKKLDAYYFKQAKNAFK